jgi:hypothetical protein
VRTRLPGGVGGGICEDSSYPDSVAVDTLLLRGLEACVCRSNENEWISFAIVKIMQKSILRQILQHF